MTVFIILFISIGHAKTIPSDFAFGVGEQQILRVNGPVLVTHSKAITVITKGRELRIIGKQPGTARILDQKTKQVTEVVVYSSKIAGAIGVIKSWIGNTVGITMNLRPDKIIFRGTALRIADWHKLQTLKKHYSFIESEVQLSVGLFPELAHSVTRNLRDRALSSVHIDIQNGRPVLLTSSKNKEEVSAANEIANEWGLPKSSLTNEVELKPMVEVEIVIAEVKKNAARSLGLKLPGTYSATVIPASDLSSAMTEFAPLNPEFNFSLSSASARVLANPKLVCRSGEAAHFVAGGEIPIKIISWRNSDVIWKRYGVILDITPLADYNNGISTKIATEVSLIDEAHKVDGIPGFLTNRIDSHFDLRGSKTIALSGLIKSEVGRSVQGNPILSEIPILGELFKSRDYKDNRTELIVFVTPRVISPENPPPPAQAPSWLEDDD